MSADLDEQLAAYGAWLSQTTGADLSPSDRPLDEAGRSRGEDDGPGPSRMWLRVAAVLIVAAGIGGLVVSQRDSKTPPAAVQYSEPIDPAAHLYVLPTDPEGLELSNGESCTARPDESEATSTEGPLIVFGTESDEGFSDLIVASVLDTLPEGFGDSEWTEIDTATGAAFVSTGVVPNSAVAQQRGGRWLLLTGATGDQDLIDVLPHVEVDLSGTPTIQDGPRVVVEEINHDPTIASYSTFYDVTDPTSGITFEVETATFPSATILGSYTPNPITPITVNGTEAWVLTRDDDSAAGVSTGIVWRATPNRVITIGAEAPLLDVQAMAERLQQVTEEEWLTALPAASIQN